jgi:hypothetical protein
MTPTATAEAVLEDARDLGESRSAFVDVSVALLGDCPSCGDIVPPDAGAVRYRDYWYHLRCALAEREVAR